MFQSTNPFNKEKKSWDALAIFLLTCPLGETNIEEPGFCLLIFWGFFCPDYDLFVVPAALTAPNLDKVWLKSWHSLLTTQSANKASASRPLQMAGTRRNSPQEPDLKRNGTFLLPKYRKKKSMKMLPAAESAANAEGTRYKCWSLWQQTDIESWTKHLDLKEREYIWPWCKR